MMVADQRSFSTLVSSDVLASRLDDPAWVVVDCRFDLANPGWGEGAYRDAHITRANYAHLDRDLSGTPDGHNGRHPLPPLDRLATTFGEWGIGDGTQVVVYDQGPGMYASRLWWLLRYLGHDAAAVLDGGYDAWTREGRSVRGGAEQPRSARFQARVRPSMLASVADVQRGLDDTAHRLIDARAAERFEGQVEPLDPVAGHIPGAANYCFQENLRPDGTFQAPSVLRERLAAVLGGVDPARTVCYCGSGVTACHDLLALEHAGLHGARLYAGSWSEWCSDAARPVETGPARPTSP